MLPFLDTCSPFPPVSQALDEPNGLLAAGADLSTERLLLAYSLGIFPWYSEDEPILWWSPNPRTVILLDQYKPSRSLCRFVRQSNLSVTLNTQFELVMQRCSEPRKDQPTTWISDEIKQAYCALHRLGKAHSVEVWQNEELVGGIYGVSIGKLFCGESMFSGITNGSKIALASLIGYLRTNGFPMIDCQVENPHLMSLGATNIGRNAYLQILDFAVQQPIETKFWQSKHLKPQSLITRNINV